MHLPVPCQEGDLRCELRHGTGPAARPLHPQLQAAAPMDHTYHRHQIYQLGRHRLHQRVRIWPQTVRRSLQDVVVSSQGIQEFE